MKRRQCLTALMTGRLAIAWIAGANVGATHAAEVVPAIADAVRQRLVDAPVVRGLFEQRKTIKGFRNPLVSRGDFVVSRSQGVLWRTSEPFLSSLVVTRDRLLARQADGSVATQLSSRDEPGLRAINELLFALMATDLQLLAHRFHFEGELQSDRGWRLVLLPRDASLARWVIRIELEGDRFVRTVRLAEATGDTSVLQFAAPVAASALTRAEESDFE